MAKTHKVANVQYNGAHLSVIRVDGEPLPFRVYCEYYTSGHHRKLVAKYERLDTALRAIASVPQYRD